MMLMSLLVVVYMRFFFLFFLTLPDGITTSAPSAGTVKLFSAELFQKEALDQALERKKQTNRNDKKDILVFWNSSLLPLMYNMLQLG